MAKNTNLKMFIEALFIIAKIWRQPKCPSTDERVKKLWGGGCVCVCITEYCKALKKNDILPSRIA